jgi:hypothetical protein
LILSHGKPPKDYGRDKFYTYVDELNKVKGAWAGFYKDSDIFMIDGVPHTDAIYFKLFCKPGDVLYVRETYKRNMDGYSGIDFGGYIYKADCKQVFKDDYNPWHPSIHMPKEAARIFLRVKEVKVDKLQDITREQAVQEGINIGAVDSEKYANSKAYAILADNLPIATFADLWNSTHKKYEVCRLGWKANPWVWVIEFERISKEEALQS